MKFGQDHYRPLLEGLTIQKSSINRLGLHATEEWKAGVYLGETHIWNDYVNEWIRTPLGGFINHSDTPNCCKVMSYKNSALDYYTLQTAEDIKSGEELTLTYTIYGIDDATS